MCAMPNERLVQLIFYTLFLGGYQKFYTKVVHGFYLKKDFCKEVCFSGQKYSFPTFFQPLLHYNFFKVKANECFAVLVLDDQ